MKIVPCSLAEANDLVARFHRHNGVLRGGSYFAVGLTNEQGVLIGASIVGPISARLLAVAAREPTTDRTWGCEIKRLVTDGSPNACSMLYGASVRIAIAMGFEGLITYTLTTESGKSLRASNWKVDEDVVPVRVWKSRAPEFQHLPWSQRPTTQNSPALPRIRWFYGRRIPSKSGVIYDADEVPIAGETFISSKTPRTDAVVVSTPSTSDLQSERPRETRGDRTPLQGS